MAALEKSDLARRKEYEGRLKKVSEHLYFLKNPKNLGPITKIQACTRAGVLEKMAGIIAPAVDATYEFLTKEKGLKVWDDTLLVVCKLTTNTLGSTVPWLHSCEFDPSQYVMDDGADGDDTQRYPDCLISNILQTVCHELIHADQGEKETQREVRMNLALQDFIDYHDRPWEQEAFSKSNQLMPDVIDHINKVIPGGTASLNAKLKELK